MKKLLRKCCVIMLLALLNNVQAQQVGMYNHYFFNPVYYNPAMAGSTGDIRASLITRAQWAGFHNAPQLNFFTIDGALKEKKIGLGLTLVSDRRGINRRTGGNVSYAYAMNFSDEGRFVLGISAGAINHGIDFTQAVAEDYSDPTLFFAAQQRTVLDANAGLALLWKGLEFAFAAPQLLESKINYLDNTGTRTSYAQKRHFMGSLKYAFNLSEEKGITLAPQFLMRMVPNAPFQFDGNLTLMWKEKFWIGGTYKSSYAVAANAGVYLHERFCVGYSYEFITGGVGTYSGLSHELMVSVRFGGKKGSDSKAEDTASTADNVAANSKVDSLKDELAQSREQINELSRKLAEQGAKQQENFAKLQETQAKVAELEKKLAEYQANPGAANSAATTSTANANSNTVTQNNNSGSQSSGNNTASTGTGGNKSSSTKTGGGTKAPKTNTSGGNTANAGSGNEANMNVPAPQPQSQTQVDGYFITNYAASDYADANNSPPSPEYYIVVGSFSYKDYALDQLARFKSTGYKGANWFQSAGRRMNYVYTFKVNNPNDAVSRAKEMQAAGIKDAWIIKLN